MKEKIAYRHLPYKYLFISCVIIPRRNVLLIALEFFLPVGWLKKNISVQVEISI